MLKHTPTISEDDIERETKAIVSVLMVRYQDGDIDENTFMSSMQRTRSCSDDIKEKLYRMQQIVATPEYM